MLEDGFPCTKKKWGQFFLCRWRSYHLVVEAEKLIGIIHLDMNAELNMK